MTRARHLALLLLGTLPALAQPGQPAAPQLPPGALPEGQPAAQNQTETDGPGAPPSPGQAPAPIVPPAVPTPAPAPGTPPAPPAAPQAPAVPLEQTIIDEDIVEPKLSGNELAGLYRKYTGRRVLVTSAAAAAEFSFIQDASPEDPLTYALAADLLRKAAVLESFVFVPDATDPNLDILTLATSGIRPSQRGIDVYTEADALPDTDAVISYVMSFDHIKPENAMNAFTQIIGQFGAFGSIAAIPNAASVVITENTSLIRKLIDLKKEIDKPSSQVATRFIRVQYADVTELATTLNELIGAQQQAQTTAGIQRAPQQAVPEGGAPPGVPGTTGGGASSSGEATPVQIVAEPRTSRIFAMGRPVDLIFIEGLVREFDIETDNRTFLRRKLKFLTVSEFLPVAENALARAFTTSATQGGATQGGSSSRGSSRTQTTNRTDGMSSGFGGQTSQFGGSSRGGGSAGGSSSTRGNALSDPSISSAPESLLVGRTLLVADNITNSVIVQGPPSGIEIVERLLDQLDVKADQVMISTVFGQLSLGNGIETGVDYVIRSKDIVGRGGAGLFPNLPINSNTGGTTTDPFPGQLPGGPGLRLYGQVGDLSIYLRALQSQSEFTVLSRPSIFTANNQKGTISSGRRIAVPTNSNSFSAGGVSTNIEYRDVVLKLEVIPLINDENTVTLQIALVSDDVIGQSDPIEGIGTVPIIGTREILTTVTVPNNETVVLGGLITTNDEEGVSGIPVLSSIPGLGRLFSTKTNTKNRDELLVFIQPTIVNNAGSLDSLQNDTDGRYRVSNPARRFADGPGVLPAPGEITITPEKGSTTAPVATPAPAPTATEPNAARRDSLRPIHRR
jgi:general secretion pathway protein D